MCMQMCIYIYKVVYIYTWVSLFWGTHTVVVFLLVSLYNLQTRYPKNRQSHIYIYTWSLHDPEKWGQYPGNGWSVMETPGIPTNVYGCRSKKIPKMGCPGKWKHGLKPAPVYMYIYIYIFATHIQACVGLGLKIHGRLLGIGMPHLPYAWRSWFLHVRGLKLIPFKTNRAKETIFFSNWKSCLGSKGTSNAQSLVSFGSLNLSLLESSYNYRESASIGDTWMFNQLCKQFASRLYLLLKLAEHQGI